MPPSERLVNPRSIVPSSGTSTNGKFHMSEANPTSRTAVVAFPSSVTGRRRECLSSMYAPYSR